jgi:hypothetical protein
VSAKARPERRRATRTASARDQDRAARQATRGSQPASPRPRPAAPYKPAARGARAGFLDYLIIALLVVLAAMVVVAALVLLRIGL